MSLMCEVGDRQLRYLLSNQKHAKSIPLAEAGTHIGSAVEHSAFGRQLNNCYRALSKSPT